MESIKTILNHYRFDLTKSDEAEAYRKLRKNVLSKIGFPVWYMDYSRTWPSQDQKAWDYPKLIKKAAGPVELETKHLFNNQWNTAPIPGVSDKGLRLFNWSEWIYPNKTIKEGYWLEQTEEMRNVLANTHECGYCGKQEPAQKGYVFCPHCLDSEYLKSTDLHLTRMLPVSDDSKRKELTQAEKDYLLPLYKEAQIKGLTERGEARIDKARRDIAAEYEKTLKNAKEKHDAALWIMDNLPEFYSNWIFYNHTGVHCFGWRSKIDASLIDELEKGLQNFPFKFEIERA